MIDCNQGLGSSPKGPTTSKQQRKQLRKLDREIFLLDKRLDLSYIFIGDKELTNLKERRVKLDQKRWELRLRMKTVPCRYTQGQRQI